jgi:hypothetical protein
MKSFFAPDTEKTSIAKRQGLRPQKSRLGRKWLSHIGQPNHLVPLGSVLSNWAALIALWALPYLTLLSHFQIDLAQSEALQWLLVAIGASGVISVLFTAWRQTRDPAWRASHGLTTRGR